MEDITDAAKEEARRYNESIERKVNKVKKMDKRWKFVIGAGVLLLGLSVGINVLSILSPSPSVQRLETPSVPQDTDVVEIVPEDDGLLEYDMARKDLISSCMIELESQIEEMEMALVESRARRFENYAQMESERLGISIYEFLIGQYNATAKELSELTRFGTLPTTAKETREYRDLVGKLKDIRLAIVGRPEGKRNIPAGKFVQALNDCEVKAILLNNLNKSRHIEMMNSEW